MSTDTHPLRAGILRAIQTEPRNSAELSRCLSSHAPRNISATLDALVADGLVALKWGRYRMTKLGRESMPSHSTLPPMQPYVSPRVWRRPGSEVAARLPSIAGGRLIERVRP